MTRRTGGDRRIFSELGRRKTLGDRRKESRKKLEEAVATIKRIWPADFDAERLRGVLTLREEYQLMIYLDEVRKLKRSEIAETIGCKSDSVGSRVDRAQKALEEALIDLRVVRRRKPTSS